MQRAAGVGTCAPDFSIGASSELGGMERLRLYRLPQAELSIVCLQSDIHHVPHAGPQGSVVGG